MGRITIFSANDCDDSICVLAALDKMDIPYNEINVSLHPDRRRDLLSLTGRLSLPQVFLNRQPLGGADETIRMLKHWQADKKALGITPRERFAFEIERQPYPTDPRLAPPSDSSSCCSPHVNPAQQQEEKEQKPVFVGRRPPQASDALVLPNGNKTTVVEMMELLKRILPIQDHTYHMRAYRDCFLGSEAVQSLSEHYQISRGGAVQFGRYLQDRHILDHVVGEHDFDDTGYFYRLHCHQTPHVLNSYRRWPKEGAIVLDFDSLLRDLAGLIRWIEMELSTAAAAAKQGRGGPCRAQEHPSFHTFEEAVCELQAVDLSSMNDQAKTAFGINVYNLMIKYAFMKVGSFGSSDLQRLTFFAQVKFNVGGHVYSFQEWEHGFLRGNKPPSNLFRRPFNDQDPRAALVVKEPDVRLHFALNCGARTCPPVKLLSSEHLQTELAIAALHFCQDSANVRLDASNQVVHLSKIFYWFRGDFGRDDAQLLAKLLGYLRGSKRRALQKMLSADSKENNNASAVKVAFLDYDWSVTTPFESMSVNKTTGGRNPRMLRIKGLLPRRQSRGPR